MENKAIKTKNLKLARVRYFDSERRGAELGGMEAYVFLMKAGDGYFNVFDLTDNLTVYDRSMYSNVLRNGMEFGNRLICVSGNEETGPCYVIEPVSGEALIGTDRISLNGLKEYVYRSDKFFVDRIHLIEEEKTLKKIKMRQTLKADQEKMGELRAYFENHDCANQYVK